MLNPLFQTRTDWTATARCISLATGKGCARHDVHNAVTGKRSSSRLSALLAQHEVKKVDWRAVAALISECYSPAYKPRYVYEVAKGWRNNKRVEKHLRQMGIEVKRRAAA